MSSKWRWGIFTLIVAIILFLLPSWINVYRAVNEQGILKAEITFENDEVIFAGTAITEAQKRQGLSGREQLLGNEGLLFFHEPPEKPAYWMKDMNFPIDIIWIRDGEIVDIHENLQPENPAKTFYSPKSKINNVLEVNAGFVSENEVKIGDLLDIGLINE